MAELLEFLLGGHAGVAFQHIVSLCAVPVR
jgi:hypothetical protein